MALLVEKLDSRKDLDVERAIIMADKEIIGMILKRRSKGDIHVCDR